MSKTKIILRAIELKDKGLTQANIAKVLNKEGYKTDAGGNFCQSGVSKLLCGAGLHSQAKNKKRKKPKIVNQATKTGEPFFLKVPSNATKDVDRIEVIALVSISDDFTKEQKRFLLERII